MRTMNKDIRINWNVGMELTPETFIHLENQLAEYRQLLRKVQASRQFGIIPNTEFNVSVSVDGDTLSLSKVACQALLPKGEMVSLNHSEELSFHLDNASGSCYLAVWPSEEEHTYELDDVPFVENGYQFGLRSLNELPGSMPLAKMIVEDGSWVIQNDYILPVMAMETSPVMLEMVTAIRQLALQITLQEKFELLRNHDLMKLLVEEMESVESSQHPKDFVTLSRRFIRLFSYLTDELPKPDWEYNPYDIQLYLYNVCSYLIKAHEILPTLEVVEYQAVPKQEPVAEPELEPEEDFPIL